MTGLILNNKSKERYLDLKADIETRCPHCNKLFFKGEASKQPQQFKCSRCGKLVTIQKAN